MADQHVYFAVENLALNNTQRAALVQALRSLGPALHPRPACLCHWRTRLDNGAAIFEALFDQDHITVQATKARLAAIFAVSAASIDHGTNQVTFAARPTAVVTFSRSGTDYLRMAIFGYNGSSWPTWMESGDEARAYLAQYRDLWEEAS